jgi:hypothetical protein
MDPPYRPCHFINYFRLKLRMDSPIYYVRRMICFNNSVAPDK